MNYKKVRRDDVHRNEFINLRQLKRKNLKNIRLEGDLNS